MHRWGRSVGLAKSDTIPVPDCVSFQVAILGVTPNTVRARNRTVPTTDTPSPHVVVKGVFPILDPRKRAVWNGLIEMAQDTSKNGEPLLNTL